MRESTESAGDHMREARDRLRARSQGMLCSSTADFCRDANMCRGILSDRSSMSGPSRLRWWCECCERKARVHNVRSSKMKWRICVECVARYAEEGAAGDA